ncbi:phage tail tip fiber protein [Pseudoalteromonas agarivorans]|uniref:phage tail tip fiber protein n=1 Tax=Pseudoalteromonas agarivorans TaxID=176102 RepID=UPI00249A66A1|nr:hypothetical protein [Pseudoalteromonas agarivorans]MDI3243827.1 hypothetical protein [Pseudoalteromonas agarivorans]
MSRALPPVPKDVSRSVSQFLNSLRETVQIQAGMGRGNTLDRAVTFRDLKKAIGTDDLSSVATKSATGVVTAFNDPMPTKPTNFAAFGMFNMVGLEWDRPKADWYAATEIYRVDVTDDLTATPVFSEAEYVGTSATGFFSDLVEPARTFVYWARHLNRDYQAGDISSPEGTRASTSESPEQVLVKFSEEVADSNNFKWLRSDLSIMDTINRTLQGSSLGDSGLADLINGSATLSDMLAEQAMSEALSKHTQTESIQQQFAKNYARLSGGIHAAVNADEAYVLRIQELESKWENDLGKIVDAKITEFDTVLSSSEGAIAQAIRNFTVDYDGTNVSLQQLASTTASQGGIYEAQWGVKTSVAGLQGGVGFLNDGTQTSFVVDAQTFAVTGGNENVFPFIIKDGKTVIDKAFIQDAEIYNLLAANIVAERVKVGLSFSSPSITGGSIDGATLTIGDRFSVSQDGIMRTRDGFFEGNVAAKSGYLENVRIDESCTIEGTLYAQNIEGDIVDRTVIVVDREIEVGPREVYILIQGTISPGLLGATEERVLVISGIALDHQGGGGSTSNFDVYLRLDGSVVQKFHSHNVEEEGSVTVQMGCHIPKGTAEHTFAVELRPDVNDNILVQQSAIVADVFKTGSTFKGVSGLHY